MSCSNKIHFYGFVLALAAFSLYPPLAHGNRAKQKTLTPGRRALRGYLSATKRSAKIKERMAMAKDKTDRVSNRIKKAEEKLLDFQIHGALIENASDKNRRLGIQDPVLNFKLRQNHKREWALINELARLKQTIKRHPNEMDILEKRERSAQNRAQHFNDLLQKLAAE